MSRLILSLGLLATLGSSAFAAAPDRLSAAIAQGDYPKTTSVLVMRGDRLIYERYFGDGKRALLNDTRSAMKAVTALAVGAAIADGMLSSAQAPAFPYLSDLKPFANDTADKEAITLADMLSMTSALDCNDNDDASPGNEDRMHEQQNWTRWAVDLPTMPGYARDATGQGPWRYCTANAFLAGQVVQRATHMSVDAYIARRLLKPLGIARWEWPRSPTEEVMTGGGLKSGRVIGGTDKEGVAVDGKSYLPGDVWATVAHALGIPLNTVYTSKLGRPMKIVNGGTPIQELIS